MTCFRMKSAVSAVAWLATAGIASAFSMDVSGWSTEGLLAADGRGGSDWQVASDGKSVTQVNNSLPSVFFESGANHQGSRLKASVRVDDTTDDDFIGFVLGYDAGEFSSTSADFWLIDWKVNQQGYRVSGARSVSASGLSFSHVTGDLSDTSRRDFRVDADFWSHSNTVSEGAGTDVAWNNGQTYDFDILYSENLVEIWLDGVLQISQSGTFGPGAFGFYNFSQREATYAMTGATPWGDVSPVPVPASLPLLLGGVAALGLTRRRRRT